ncbi:hypothetical protein KIPB_009238, partial [Kipferlia bialata]|eukprot:g9238.t1
MSEPEESGTSPYASDAEDSEDVYTPLDWPERDAWEAETRPDIARVILDCYENGHIQIGLLDADMGDYDAASVAEALPYIPHVTSIGLYRNRIGDAGAIALSRTIHELACLREVYFDHNEMGPSGVAALCESLGRNGDGLKGLGFAGMPIGDMGSGSLARSLSYLPSLRLLELSGTDMGDVGACALADILPVMPSLARLDLSCNHIGDEGALRLSQILPYLPELEYLWLQDNVIGPKGESSLMEAMSNLPWLQSSSIEIGFQGWENWEYGVSPELVLAVRTARREGESDFICERLTLEYSRDVDALCQALMQLPHISGIFLTSNQFGRWELDTLSATIGSLSNLKLLCIMGDPLRDAGVKSLAEHLPNLTKLTS